MGDLSLLFFYLALVKISINSFIILWRAMSNFSRMVVFFLIDEADKIKMNVILKLTNRRK